MTQPRVARTRPCNTEVIAVFHDPRLVEKILRHLRAWHDPPPRLPPQEVPGPYTFETCDDVDAMPDYKNALPD